MNNTIFIVPGIESTWRQSLQTQNPLILGGFHDRTGAASHLLQYVYLKVSFKVASIGVVKMSRQLTPIRVVRNIRSMNVKSLIQGLCRVSNIYQLAFLALGRVDDIAVRCISACCFH